MVSISPGFMNVKVPTGTNDDEETVTINNQSDEKIGFKIKGTKLDKFQIEPGFGLVKCKDKVEIKIQSGGFTESEKLNPNDHFTFQIITACQNATNARKVWQSNSQEPKKYIFRVNYVKTGQKAKSNKGTKANQRAEKNEENAKEEEEEEENPKKKSGKNAGPAVDESTNPPEDLKEVPSFQEFYYRKYD